MLFLKRVINSGLLPGMISQEKRHIRLTNIYNLIFIFCISLPTIGLVLYINSGFQSYIRFILLIIFCIVNIALNRRKLHLAAKISTIYSPLLLVFIFPMFNQFLRPGMFLWFPYSIMILGALSFFIFSFEKEKTSFNITILVFVVLTIFYDSILLKAVPNNLDLSFIYVDNYFFFTVSKVMLISFLYSSLYLAKITSYKNMNELAQVNRKLDQKNNELKFLNQNLEAIVKQRTEKLILQNARIKELAYTNSHEIRACVARIIGLVNVTNEDIAMGELTYYYYKIKETSLQLEEVTQRISKELVEEN
jgi:hypothetical protein